MPLIQWLAVLQNRLEGQLHRLFDASRHAGSRSARPRHGSLQPAYARRHHDPQSRWNRRQRLG
jgi:hypothetical protein